MPKSAKKTVFDIEVFGEDSGRAFNIRAFRIGLVGGIGVLVAILLSSVVSQLGTLLVYVGIALFIALGLDPIVSWLQRHRIKRPLAILLVFVFVLAIFAGLLATVVPIAVDQATYLAKNWDTRLSLIQKSDFTHWLNSFTTSGIALNDVFAAITDWLKKPETLGQLGGGLLQVGLAVIGGFTGATIVVILTLYFLASMSSMKRYATNFIRKESREKFAQISDEITGAVGRYVIGQVSLGAVNGVLSLIYLSIIGAPFPTLLAFVAFLCSLLPLVGTISGAIIISLVCLTATPVTAAAAAIYYLIYMQIEAYVLSPRIMSRAVSVPGALVVITAVAGGTLGGVAGALVAIPVAASIIIVLERVVFPRQEQR